MPLEPPGSRLPALAAERHVLSRVSARETGAVWLVEMATVRLGLAPCHQPALPILWLWRGKGDVKTVQRVLGLLRPSLSPKEMKKQSPRGHRMRGALIVGPRSLRAPS